MNALKEKFTNYMKNNSDNLEILQLTMKEYFDELYKLEDKISSLQQDADTIVHKLFCFEIFTKELSIKLDDYHITTICDIEESTEVQLKIKMFISCTKDVECEEFCSVYGDEKYKKLTSLFDPFVVYLSYNELELLPTANNGFKEKLIEIVISSCIKNIINETARMLFKQYRTERPLATILQDSPVYTYIDLYNDNIGCIILQPRFLFDKDIEFTNPNISFAPNSELYVESLKVYDNDTVQLDSMTETAKDAIKITDIKRIDFFKDVYDTIEKLMRGKEYDK